MTLVVEVNNCVVIEVQLGMFMGCSGFLQFASAQNSAAETGGNAPRPDIDMAYRVESTKDHQLVLERPSIITDLYMHAVTRGDRR